MFYFICYFVLSLDLIKLELYNMFWVRPIFFEGLAGCYMMQNIAYRYRNVLFMAVLLTMSLFEKLEIEKQRSCFCIYILLFCIKQPIYAVFMQ